MPIRITDLRSDAEIVALINALFLKLDQTTHQHVINGAPRFDGGIVIKSGQKLVFDGGEPGNPN